MEEIRKIGNHVLEQITHEKEQNARQKAEMRVEVLLNENSKVFWLYNKDYQPQAVQRRDIHGNLVGMEIVEERAPYAIKDDIIYVKWVWGCCLCFDVKKLKKEVGFFDERFFLFYEEDDLLCRIREKNLKIVMPITSIIEHYEGTGSEQTKAMSYRRQWNMDWSRMYYREKRKGKLRAKIKALIYIFEGCLKLILSNNKKRAKSLISANFAYFIGLSPFLNDNVTPRV